MASICPRHAGLTTHHTLPIVTPSATLPPYQHTNTNEKNVKISKICIFKTFNISIYLSLQYIPHLIFSTFTSLNTKLDPGPNTTGLLETLFIYIFPRLAQASVQALYNLSSSPVVLGPGAQRYKKDHPEWDPNVWFSF